MLLFVTTLGYASIYNIPAYSLQTDSRAKTSRIECHFIVSKDTIISFNNISNSISGLAVSGRTTILNEDAVVRIILVDSEGGEYLVYEDFYMYQETKEDEFSEIAIETAILNNILPNEIRIFVQNALIEISEFVYTYDHKNIHTYNKIKEEVSMKQEEYQIERWNKSNAVSGQYWIAGKTSISAMRYSQKKAVLGVTDDHFLSDGIEYYIGGFFVIKTHNRDNIRETQDSLLEKRTRMTNNSYVDSFDWRNRHGKNWMTSVKHQAEPYNNISGNGGCWIFGPIAALESHINLYYNRLLNVDLSEQEVGSCIMANTHGIPSLHSGGYPENTYNYILNNGVVNEECFSFFNDSTIPCETKCDTPLYTANLTNFSSVYSGTDQLKNAVINNGPIASGYCNGYTCHVMCLCGYGTIHEGTHLDYVSSSPIHNIDTIIPANSDLIGKTYWIYKNSYGPNHGINGYLYAIYEKDNTRGYTVSLTYPTSISTLNTSDVLCEDADNDGYYFWGLGAKPENCPICCPDTPDGDDSNPLLAEMDNYGNFLPYTLPYPTTTISIDTTWNTNQTHCGNIVITNNATLTITAEVTMNPIAKITVQDGGTLIVNGGAITNSSVDVRNSAKLQLLNNGTLYLKQMGNLKIQLGAEAEMKCGRVLLQ